MVFFVEMKIIAAVTYGSVFPDKETLGAVIKRTSHFFFELVGSRFFDTVRAVFFDEKGFVDVVSLVNVFFNGFHANVVKVAFGGIYRIDVVESDEVGAGIRAGFGFKL